jgi:hypothetical protein
MRLTEISSLTIRDDVQYRPVLARRRVQDPLDAVLRPGAFGVAEDARAGSR